jgi:leader peptidase (prepilin peptidase)/N-methyltransferase
VDFLLNVPLVIRLAGLFVLGALFGGWINWAVYRLAWNQRSISPWSRPLPAAPPRKLTDRVPIFGWFGLRREVRLHGPRFWLRPLAVEVFSGVALATLYVWEAHDSARLWAPPGLELPPAEFLSSQLSLAEHLRFVSHAALMFLMLAASLIDLDEKTIPDGITVPGTLLGVTLAAVYPWSLLPAAHFAGGHTQLEFLTLASPELWPSSLSGKDGLWLALACWTLWSFGLLPRRWNVRRGLRTAVRVFLHRLLAERLTYLLVAMWLVGAAGLAGLYPVLPEVHWAGLLTALVGMMAGGGIIWCVRIIAGVVLRREAMGFGDVTLMAMIGAVVGWQATLMVFFVAPFFALLFAVGNWVLNREREVPYGPFLCLAAMTVIVEWPWFWDNTAGLFSLGWIVPAMFGACLVLMGLMLWAYELLRRLVLGGH